MSGGGYPQTLDRAAFWKLFAEDWEKSHPSHGQKLSDQQAQEEHQQRLNELVKFTKGLGFVFEQLPREADAHYGGKGVKLGAADKPIFWYRPKDAKQYRVIYGDLSVREADTPPSVPDAQAVISASGPKK